MSNRSWSVGIRSILSGLDYGRFENASDIESEFDSLIAEIHEAKQYSSDLFLKRESCDHVFGKATYTTQRRVIGYARVNERVCKDCGIKDVYQEDMDGNGSDRPEWAKNATEQYYNNYI